MEIRDSYSFDRVHLTPFTSNEENNLLFFFSVIRKYNIFCSSKSVKICRTSKHFDSLDIFHSILDEFYNEIEVNLPIPIFLIDKNFSHCGLHNIFNICMIFLISKIFNIRKEVICWNTHKL